MKLKFN